MAPRYGYVFYVTPGPGAVHEHRLLGAAGAGRRAAARRSRSTWAPQTNVDAIDASSTTPWRPTMSRVRSRTGRPSQTMPVHARSRALRPPLAAHAGLLVNQPNVRTVAAPPTRRADLRRRRSRARTAGPTRRPRTSSAPSGELDGLRYGGAAPAARSGRPARRRVQHDGIWYVKRVTHEIKPRRVQAALHAHAARARRR